MRILLEIGATVAAFFIGRLVQWVKDARSAMGKPSKKR